MDLLIGGYKFHFIKAFERYTSRFDFRLGDSADFFSGTQKQKPPPL
jgi:hypothetical protein